MPKLRSDAIWNILTPEQRTQIEHWLFEDNLSYRDAYQRALNELALTCSLSTFSRFYKYILRERANQDLLDAEAALTDLSTGPATDKMRAAALKLLTARLLEKTIAGADLKEIAVLGRLVLQAQDREIQQQRATLARDKFEHKASQAALKAAPFVDDLAAEDEAREVARVHQIKLRLFGSELLAKLEASDDPYSASRIPSRAPASPCVT